MPDPAPSLPRATHGDTALDELQRGQETPPTVEEMEHPEPPTASGPRRLPSPGERPGAVRVVPEPEPPEDRPPPPEPDSAEE